MKYTSLKQIVPTFKRQLRLIFGHLALIVVTLVIADNSIYACPIDPNAFISAGGQNSDLVLPKVSQKMEELYQRFYCIDRRTYFEKANYEISKLENLMTKVEMEKVQNFRLRHNMSVYDSESRNYGGDLRRQQSFLQKFSTYRSQKSLPAVNAIYENYEILLVAGFGNEAYRVEYFSDMKDVLINNFGVPEDQIHVVFTNSLAASDVSIKLVFDEYNLIKAKEPLRKILLVGHSRGGWSIKVLRITNPPLL